MSEESSTASLAELTQAVIGAASCHDPHFAATEARAAAERLAEERG